MYESNYSLFSYGKIEEQTELFNFGMAPSLGERKLNIYILKVVKSGILVAWCLTCWFLIINLFAKNVHLSKRVRTSIALLHSLSD